MDGIRDEVSGAIDEKTLRAVKASLMSASREELSGRLVSSVPFEALSRIIRDEAKRLTGSDIGFMGYVDLRTGRLVSPSMNDEEVECCQLINKDSLSTKCSGLWGFVLKNRVPVMSNDLRRDPRACGLPTGHIPIGRFVSAPALGGEGGPLLGIVAVANADREYGMGDQAIVQRLAYVYALALEHMWREEHGIDCATYACAAPRLDHRHLPGHAPVGRECVEAFH